MSKVVCCAFSNWDTRFLCLVYLYMTTVYKYSHDILFLLQIWAHWYRINSNVVPTQFKWFPHVKLCHAGQAIWWDNIKVLFPCSESFNLPKSNCYTVKHRVKHNLKVTLIRELTMENAGIHKPFVKELYNERIYYGEPVDVFCMFDLSL